MPKFDVDLCRVSHEHYITGKAAINFPWPATTTGGWHHLSYWDREAGQVKVSLAGIHYPDTSAYFGQIGIIDASQELTRRGWTIDHEIYMANHFRAASDMVLAWALGQSKHCNVELSAWFPEDQDQCYILQLITSASDKMSDSQGDRINQWVELQLRRID